MDLLKKHITHKSFGEGVVTEIESDIITVRFNKKTGTKQFIYPDAFEHFLVMDDPDLNTAVTHDLDIKLKKSEQERLLKEKQQQETEQKRVRELTEEKAKNKKKPASRKKTAEKIESDTLENQE